MNRYAKPGPLHSFLFAFVLFIASLTASAQITDSTRIRDYAIYAEGNHPAMNDSTRFGVQIGNQSRVHGDFTSGLVGSNFLINIGSGNNFTGNIYSGNRINLGSNNNVFASMAARNDRRVTIPVIRVFGNENQFDDGNLQARGNIFMANGNSVAGGVVLENPYTYNGPEPGNGLQFLDTLGMPVLPALPFPTTFPAVGTSDITGSTSLRPGSYGNLVMNGGDTVTLTVPGVYVFRSIKGYGLNTLNFLFGSSESMYQIYVYEDVDLGPMQILIDNEDANSGSFVPAGRIYTEVHGSGRTFQNGSAFRLKDTTTITEIQSTWVGTVYATNGKISIGSVFGENTFSVVYGALWSKTMVEIGNGVDLQFSGLDFTPVVINPYLPPPPGGKVNDKIGAELTSISENPGIITAIPVNDLFRIDTSDAKVMIEVIAMSTDYDALLTFLVSNGFELVSRAEDKLIITGYYPVSKLSGLNFRSDIDHVRPLFEPINNAGQVTTQGDATMRSDLVRSRFGIEGDGVKVGILSDSWDTRNGAALDIQEGDLPPDAQVVTEFPDLRSDEGRAMGQIVHDVAPKAKLFFRTGCISPLDFSLGIRQLAGQAYNCDVIVDDITYITEPFLKDGLVAQAVNDVVTQNGVTYITSAGNFGSKSYQGTFAPMPGAFLPNGISGTAHNFGGSSRQVLNLKRGTYTIVLQWDDQFYSLGGNAGAAVDLDIYLVAPDGSYFGFNRNNITQDPIEVLPFNVNEDTEAQLLIVRAGGAANVRFKYIIFRGEATIEGYTGSSTIVGQANAEGAISVGAMLYANVNNIVPDYPSVASFSSRGGTAVNSVVRQKPDLVAPNGVNTTVPLSTDPINDIEGDDFPNFFGTSAAAPHAAGAAALLIEGKKRFNLQTTVTQAEIKAMMQTTALDLHEPGFDFKSGAGAIQADEAMLTIANARPIITALEAPPGLTPGNTTPFELKVKGRYLTTQTKIYVRGAEIPTTFINNTLVSANVTGPINDDPAIQLYNPPKSPSNLDGGLSEELYLFSSKKRIVVKAENKTKKYGEALPAFTYTVTINGEPLSQTTETLASLKLESSQVQFATFATQESSVANYSITPSRITPLDPTNTTDAALLAQYTFQFEPGTLIVQKLPLKITPKNQIITYGELPNQIEYNFDFGGAAPPAAIRTALETAYRKYMAENALVVINGLPSPVSGQTLNTLNNMSTMASFQSIINARKFVFENGQLVPQTGPLPDDKVGDQRFLVDLAAQSLTSYEMDSAAIALVPAPPEDKLRGLISARALANGTAQASLPNGQLRAIVNGQLLPVVNGQLRAIVNGQLRALVNGVMQDVEDLIFFNGQLRALVNGSWIVVTNGQLRALVNGEDLTIDMSVENGQLRALVNGQMMTLVNGQLRALVNGLMLDLVNGQLQAVVNGQLMPVVNGQLRALVNGQLLPVVNGQMLVVVNDELVPAEYVEALPNGQLRALVNGQLRAIVNGQVLSLVNGQLRALVNGQLMAEINGRLSFVVFNGQLRALVNGIEVPVLNGQLRALVNGSLQSVDDVTITNGQLRALVNGQTYDLINGQLRALVNNLPQPVVNNFGGITPTSNSHAAVVIDGEDINLQDGAIGGMFAVNMITGLNPGMQKLVPGTFFNPNIDVSYGMGDVTILPAPTDDVTLSNVWYRDFDRDGFGDPRNSRKAISQPAGFVANSLDCNDYRVHYEDKDNDGWGNPKKIPCGIITRTGDCDDNNNKVHSLQTFYRDADGDSYGDAGNTIVLCSSVPPAGYVANRIDCNDNDANVYWLITYYRDADGDGLGNANNKVNACSATPPTGYVVNNRDTNDAPALPPVTQPANTLAKSALEVGSEREAAASVYPNPARERVRIQTDAAIVTGNLVISDANGRTYVGLPNRKINDRTVELTVSSLASGVYMVQVKTANGFRTLRFTKL